MISRMTLGRAVAASLILTIAWVPAAHAAEINGTDDPETLQGTDDNDVVRGFGGDDVLDGLGLNDFLDGGTGNDELFGGAGGDDIEGNSDNDVLHGDRMHGGSIPAAQGNDTLNGFYGDDELHGDGGNDLLLGGPGVDELFGGDDDDRLYGDKFRDGSDPESGRGADHLEGGAGDDVLCGQGGGDDTLVGGPGLDVACAVDDPVIEVAPSLTFKIDVAANDEQLDDELTENEPLRYSLVDVPPGLTATIHELTGVVTISGVDADVIEGGTIAYHVTRSGSTAWTEADLPVQLDGDWDGTSGTAVTTLAAGSRYGTPKPATVVVTSGMGMPSAGTVQVRAGTSVIASAPVQDGVATPVLPRTLPTGAHSLTFAFLPAGGTGLFGSQVVRTHTVSKDATRPRVIWKRKPTSNRKGRMKVLVRPVYGAIAPYTGTIRVMSGTKRIGSATVSNGVAVVTIRKLARRTHRIKVRYLGSANHLASVKKLRLVVRR